MAHVDLSFVMQLFQVVSLLVSVLWSTVKIINKVENLEKYVKESVDRRLDEHDKRITVVEEAVVISPKTVRRLKRR